MTRVELINIINWWCRVKNKSQRVGETLLTASSIFYIIFISKKHKWTYVRPNSKMQNYRWGPSLSRRGSAPGQTGGAYKTTSSRSISFYKSDMGKERKRGALWSIRARVGSCYKQGLACIDEPLQLLHGLCSGTVVIYFNFFRPRILQFFAPSIVSGASIISSRPDTSTCDSHIYNHHAMVPVNHRGRRRWLCPGEDVKLIRCCPENDVEISWRHLGNDIECCCNLRRCGWFSLLVVSDLLCS